MEMSMDFRSNLAMGFTVLMALSLILVSPVAAADDDLNLPSTIVRMEVSNGTVS
jgi:hypothetical protein